MGKWLKVSLIVFAVLGLAVAQNVYALEKPAADESKTAGEVKKKVQELTITRQGGVAVPAGTGEAGGAVNQGIITALATNSIVPLEVSVTGAGEAAVATINDGVIDNASVTLPADSAEAKAMPGIKDFISASVETAVQASAEVANDFNGAKIRLVGNLSTFSLAAGEYAQIGHAGSGFVYLPLGLVNKLAAESKLSAEASLSAKQQLAAFVRHEALHNQDRAASEEVILSRQTQPETTALNQLAQRASEQAFTAPAVKVAEGREGTVAGDDAALAISRGVNGVIGAVNKLGLGISGDNNSVPSAKLDTNPVTGETAVVVAPDAASEASVLASLLSWAENAKKVIVTLSGDNAKLAGLIEGINGQLPEGKKIEVVALTASEGVKEVVAGLKGVADIRYVKTQTDPSVEGPGIISILVDQVLATLKGANITGMDEKLKDIQSWVNILKAL